MQLNLTYREMALIREALHAYRIKDLPKLKPGITGEQMGRYMEYINSQRNPFDNCGLCNIILDKIQWMEDDLKQELGM
jgi:hypothetical protein